MYHSLSCTTRSCLISLVLEKTTQSYEYLKILDEKLVIIRLSAQINLMGLTLLFSLISLYMVSLLHDRGQ